MIRPPHSPHSPRSGYTLLELLVGVVLIGILSGLAFPRMEGAMQLIRVRSALRRLTVDLHLARMLAVREGRPVDVDLVSAPDRCVILYRIAPRDPVATPLVRTMAPDFPGLCLRHNGGARLSFDPRGMARSGGKAFIAAAGAAVDTVVVSFAGRIRRTD